MDARRSAAVNAAVLALVVGAAAALAPAQVTRKPDVAPEQTRDEYTFDAERWSRVYERAGEPTILVLAGPATAERAGRGVGASLMSMDAEGDAFLLKSEIERTLLEGGNVEIANLDALSDMDRRDAELLLQSRERDAVDLLSTAVDAPLVLVARLQRMAGEGTKYRVTFEAIDVPRGRTLSTVAFDWEGGDDARSIKRYARLLVNDFVDAFERRVGEGAGEALPFTVRVLGADMRSVRDLADEIERVAGVESVQLAQRQQARDTSVAEVRVRYEGSAFDLAGELMEAGDLGAGLELDSLDMTSGTIVLRAVGGEGRMEGSRGWRLLGSDRVSVDEEALRTAYAAAGEPRIAMLIGRSLSPWEIEQPWFWDDYGREWGIGGVSANADRGGSNIFITIADEIENRVDNAPDWWGGVVTPNYEPGETERGLLESRRLEDLLVDRLGQGGLGLRMVDAVTLRERALAQNPRFVFREAELIELVRETGLADIAVFGVGRLERERGYTVVRYTLRAVELETGEVLAVAPAAVEVDDRADAEEVNEILAELVEGASARLGADLTRAWE
ncbi:MAG TPA: hypothetical protein VFF69_09635 [Phycisphaerales bacterium]|nr:hypothetical protein [Phycisphaerales bacterium]